MKRSMKKELPALTTAQLAQVVGGARMTEVNHPHVHNHNIAQYAFELRAITSLPHKVRKQ